MTTVLLIVAAVLGVALLFTMSGAKLPFIGQGSLDARGNPDRDRAPPPDVDPNSALAGDVGAAVSAAFKLASNFWKPGQKQ